MISLVLTGSRSGRALLVWRGSKPMGSHFGVGAPPILVNFSGDWDVYWGYGLLTHDPLKLDCYWVTDLST